MQSSAWALAMREENKDKGNNRNLLIVAPPGAGKTLAYLLPAAAKVVVEGEEEEEEEEEGSDDDDQNRRKRAKKASSSSSTPSSIPSPRVLILVPTRELARQVAAAARPLRRAAGLKVVRVAGGDRREDQVDKLLPSKKSGESSVHVLVATPGRLLDLVRGGDVGLGEFGVFFLLFFFGGGGGGGGGGRVARESSQPEHFFLRSLFPSLKPLERKRVCVSLARFCARELEPTLFLLSFPSLKPLERDRFLCLEKKRKERRVFSPSFSRFLFCLVLCLTLFLSSFPSSSSPYSIPSPYSFSSSQTGLCASRWRTAAAAMMPLSSLEKVLC